MSMMEQTAAAREDRAATVKVWDIAVRLFHWSLVFTFAFAFLSAEFSEKLHELSGYIIIGLISFRLTWGLVGPRHARFTDFVKSPAKILAYMRDMKAGKAKRYLGHNPAGGAMVIALLLALATITATGFAMTTNAFWGVKWIEELHELAANGTLVLVALHVGGVILASLEHRENLVKAMITGEKRPPSS